MRPKSKSWKNKYPKYYQTIYWEDQIYRVSKKGGTDDCFWARGKCQGQSISPLNEKGLLEACRQISPTQAKKLGVKV